MFGNPGERAWARPLVAGSGGIITNKRRFGNGEVPGGNVVLGNNFFVNVDQGHTPLQLVAGSPGPRLQVVGWNNNNTQPGVQMAYSRGDFVGEINAVQNGDWLGVLEWFGQGNDGVTPGQKAPYFFQAAQIRAELSGTPSNSSMPTDLKFLTTETGATSSTQGMRLDKNQRTILGSGGSRASVFGEHDRLQINTGDRGNPYGSISIFDWEDESGSSHLVFHHSRGGSDGAFTGVSDGDEIGFIAWAAADNSSFNLTAGINVIMEATFGASASGMRFYTRSASDSGINERMRIDSDAHVIVGGAAGAMEGFSGNYPKLQMVNAGQDFVGLFEYSNDDTGHEIWFLKSRGSSVNAHTIVQVDDQLGTFAFGGSGGSNFRLSGQIRCFVDDTPASNNVPGRLSFHTTRTAGAAGTREHLRIDRDGRFIFGANQDPGVGSMGNVYDDHAGYQFHGRSDYVRASIAVFTWDNQGGTGNLVFHHSRNDTIGVYTPLQDGDDMGYIGFAGVGGEANGFAIGADILVQVDGTVTAWTTSPDVGVPGRIIFRTANGTTTFDAQERLRLDGNGKLIKTKVGNQDALSGLLYNLDDPEVQILGRNTNSGESNLLIGRWSNTLDNYGPSLTFYRSKNNTIGSHDNVDDAYLLGMLRWVGDDGTNGLVGAAIYAQMDDDSNTGTMPCNLMFATQAASSTDTNATVRMRIDQNGVVVIAANPVGGDNFDPSSSFSAGNTCKLQVLGVNADTSSIGIARFSADANPPRLMFLKSSNGTILTDSVLNDGDSMGEIVFGGIKSGGGHGSSVIIGGLVDDSPSTTGIPGALYIDTASTTDSGASTRRLWIGDEGNFLIDPNESAPSGIFVIGSSPHANDYLFQTSKAEIHEFGGYRMFSMFKWTTNDEAIKLDFSKSRGAGTGNFAVCSTGDIIADINFSGTDGDQFCKSARISAFVEGTVANNSVPGRITFATNDGSSTSSPPERLRIDSGGRVITGGTASLAVAGNDNRAQHWGTDAATGGMTLGMFSSTAAVSAHLDFYRSKDATLGAATTVASGDRLGAITAYGAQQTGNFANQNPATAIRFEVDGTVSASPDVSDMPGRIVLMTTPDNSGTLTEAVRVDSAQRVGIGVTPSHLLDLKAGTSTVAPLRFASGTNLSTAAAGTNEFDGTCFYQTAIASSRQVVDCEQIACLSGTRTFTNNTNAQAIFNVPSSGALALAATTTYEFEMVLDITGFSTSSHTLNLGFALGASLTLTGMSYVCWVGTQATPATPTAPASVCYITTNSASAIIASATTANSLIAYVRGVIRTNASPSNAGTITPQLTQVTNSAAAVVQANSFFRCWPIGTNTVTTVGNWS